VFVVRDGRDPLRRNPPAYGRLPVCSRTGGGFSRAVKRPAYGDLPSGDRAPGRWPRARAPAGEEAGSRADHRHFGDLV